MHWPNLGLQLLLSSLLSLRQKHDTACRQHNDPIHTAAQPTFKDSSFIRLVSFVANCVNIILATFRYCVLILTRHKKPTTMEDQKTNGNTASSKDNTPRVTGIGGIFFSSDNTKDLKDWYAKNLGLQFSEWGSCSFEFRDMANPEEVGSLQWCPFKKESDYFAPSKKDFMINYRVQNLDGLVAQLKENGVTVLDDIASYDYGKFVHIMDAEGNKIELWEPA